MVAAIWWDLQEILSTRSLRLPDLSEVVEWVLTLWVEAILLDYHDMLKSFRVKLVCNVYAQKSKRGIHVAGSVRFNLLEGASRKA